jgi:hypothetical protein
VGLGVRSQKKEGTNDANGQNRRAVVVELGFEERDLVVKEDGVRSGEQFEWDGFGFGGRSPADGVGFGGRGGGGGTDDAGVKSAIGPVERFDGGSWKRCLGCQDGWCSRSERHVRETFSKRKEGRKRRLPR